MEWLIKHSSCLCAGTYNTRRLIKILKVRLDGKSGYLPHEQTTTGRERKTNPVEDKKKSRGKRRSDWGERVCVLMTLPPAGGVWYDRREHKCGHMMAPSAYYMTGAQQSCCVLSWCLHYEEGEVTQLQVSGSHIYFSSSLPNYVYSFLDCFNFFLAVMKLIYWNTIFIFGVLAVQLSGVGMMYFCSLTL